MNTDKLNLNNNRNFKKAVKDSLKGDTDSPLDDLNFTSDMNDHELKNALFNLWKWGASSGRLLAEGKIKKYDGRQDEMVDKAFAQIKSSFEKRQERAMSTYCHKQVIEEFEKALSDYTLEEFDDDIETYIRARLAKLRKTL